MRASVARGSSFGALARRGISLCLLALPFSAAPAAAQQAVLSTDSKTIPALALWCLTGTDLQMLPCGPAAPLSVMTMPFVRATPNSFMFPVTAEPQQFLITQPAGSMSYRAFNPCAQADVRVTSVMALAPIWTTTTTYPGVLKVTSATGTIDKFSGLRFGRGSETVGSGKNPMAGQQRIVSAMLVPIPGYPSDLAGLTCEFEIHYGGGG